MTFRIVSTLLLVAAISSGCASAPPPVQRVPFNEAEYQRLPQSGTGVVEGQAFLKTLGGDVKYGAGQVVRLFPVTSYSEQWWQVSVVEKRPLVDSDPRYSQYIRTTQADGAGNFKFTDVPPGKYFINAEVSWFAPTGFQGALQKQGGIVANRIEVSNDKTTRVMITQ